MSCLFLKIIDKEGPALRGGVDKDGNPAFSLFDMGNIACNKERDSTYGKNVFYRLTQERSEFKSEVDSFCVYLKFPGSGQRETPCATIRGLHRYLMILGGKVAAEFRKIIEGTFTRVMAGDQSLIEVINANAASDAPVQQAFRAALAQEPVLDDFCIGKKRERRDLVFDMEIAERKTALEERKAALDERKLKHASNLIEHANTAMGAINALKNWANVDERTKLQTEDHIKNILFSTMPASTTTLAITDGTHQPNETTGLSVSIVAKELGFKCSDGDLQRIGRAMAKAYRVTYKCDPSKHTQYVNGACIPVNSYTERDRSMMEQTIRSIMKSK